MTQFRLAVSALLAAIAVAGSGSESRGEPVPAAIPPPEHRPAYGPVDTLIKRELLCRSDGKRHEAAYWQEMARWRVSSAEREDAVRSSLIANRVAMQCERDVNDQLIRGALPALEAECTRLRDAPCADWARKQRLWREERILLERLCGEGEVATGIKRRIDSLSGSSYTDPGQRTVEQQARDVGLLQRAQRNAQVQDIECRRQAFAKIEVLNASLAGRDLAAERRAQAEGAASTLASLLWGLLAGDLPSDQERFTEVMAAITAHAALLRRLADGTQGTIDARPLLGAVESVTAVEPLVIRHFAMAGQMRSLRDAREGALAKYNQRRSEVSKIELDVAEEQLRRAGGARDQAARDLAAQWAALRAQLATLP